MVGHVSRDTVCVKKEAILDCANKQVSVLTRPMPLLLPQLILLTQFPNKLIMTITKLLRLVKMHRMKDSNPALHPPNLT